jgi:hypothetical protein
VRRALEPEAAPAPTASPTLNDGSSSASPLEAIS